jgi:hypothetical protein
MRVRQHNPSMPMVYASQPSMLKAPLLRLRVNQVCSKLLYADCESTKYAQSSFTPTASQPSMLKAPLFQLRVNQVPSLSTKNFDGQRPSRCTKREPPYWRDFCEPRSVLVRKADCGGGSYLPGSYSAVSYCRQPREVVSTHVWLSTRE